MLNKRGQNIGPKGRQARQVILDALKRLIDNHYPWQISVTDICAECNIRQYNFYTYFTDVSDAILALADMAAAEQPALATLIDGDWQASSGEKLAKTFITETIDFWQRHSGILAIADLMADRNDLQFLELRRLRRRPLIEAFERQISDAKANGAHPAALDCFMAAVDVVTMLDSVGARYSALCRHGYTHTEIISTHALILQARINGNGLKVNNQ